MMVHQDKEIRSDPVIVCERIWKLYGAHPKTYLASLDLANKPAPSFSTISADGYVAGVRDVSLSIMKGEILVVMGLSGSGKSTLVRCFSRLIDITGGNIYVEGQNLAQLNEKALIALRRQKMGMVFQNFALLPNRNVFENVVFPLEMRGQDVHERRQRAFEVIKLVGLEGLETRFPRELSGGQQQRVGIARSLAVEPNIWFLDEPFSALDPLIRRDMQNEFLRLQAMLSKTIIFITHDFDEALRLADRIAIMKDGAVEQVDRPDQIVRNPKTEYVARFIQDIDKSQVLHANTIMTAWQQDDPTDRPILSEALLHDFAPQLVDDVRERIPVINQVGVVVGVIIRREALNLLFG